MKIILIDNRKISTLPQMFYLVTENSMAQLDELFGFQPEPYSFKGQFEYEVGTILDFKTTDQALKLKHPVLYETMSKKLSTDQLRALVDEN